MSEVYNIKNSNVGWSVLSGLGKSKFIRSFNLWFIAIPIVAKFLESFPESTAFVLLKEELGFTWALPFSWKALYFAALFFTLANIIYTIFCPAIIKNYDSFTDFMHKDGSSEAIKHLFEPLLNKSKSGYAQMLAKNFRDHVPMTNSSTVSNSHREMIDEGRVISDSLSEAFSNVKGAYEHETPIIQYICVLFYALGFIILIGLLVMNITFVIGR
ncbi:hypothetical protein [Vibrio mimicus]|uniref:hypothetical protein n=1 Tax=Vibrio mimicus TaxID=674 RepID=UPI0011DC7104|nr:hypothetical protein [Vibrio mimicus]TXY08862.1 hypothetical protein FXE99_13600 [Vibrio mimicus]